MTTPGRCRDRDRERSRAAVGGRPARPRRRRTTSHRRSRTGHATRAARLTAESRLRHQRVASQATAMISNHEVDGEHRASARRNVGRRHSTSADTVPDRRPETRSRPPTRPPRRLSRRPRRAAPPPVDGARSRSAVTRGSSPRPRPHRPARRRRSGPPPRSGAADGAPAARTVSTPAALIETGKVQATPGRAAIQSHGDGEDADGDRQSGDPQLVESPRLVQRELDRSTGQPTEPDRGGEHGARRGRRRVPSCRPA